MVGRPATEIEERGRPKRRYSSTPCIQGSGFGRALFEVMNTMYYGSGVQEC